MYNISETMTSVRWMFEKYRWMAAETSGKLAQEKDPVAYVVIPEETRNQVLQMKRDDPTLSYAEIGRRMGLSKVPVRRICLGLYKGVRQDL